MGKVKLSVIGIFLLTVLFGKITSVYAGEKIGVVTSVLPLADFAENVGRDKVTVTVMVPPGASPHTYEPIPSQLKEVSQARMYVKAGSGVEFELVWMEKLSAMNGNMLVCDCSKGVKLIGVSEHHHDEDEHHDHQGKDPHIWLSPANAILMVTNIRDALIRIDPANNEFYRQNAREYISRLNSLDKEIKGKLSGIRNRSFIVLHPAWGYFASNYNLTQIPIEVAGKEPTARELTELIRQAKRLDIKVIFASPQFSEKSAKVIAGEINGRVVFVDPLAKNYIENLRNLTRELIRGLK